MISSSFIEREVEVLVRTNSGPVSLGRYRVEPPSVRQAITVLQAQEIEDGWPVAREVILEWLPLRLASEITSRRFKPEKAIQIASTLIRVTLPPGLEDQAEETEDRASRESWAQMIARYRHWYGGSLDDPWPLFVSTFRRIDAVKAEREIMYLTAIGGALAGDRDMIESIYERRGIAKEDMKRSDEELLEQQSKNLDLIEKQFGIIRKIRKN